jgi:hypothetical protein
MGRIEINLTIPTQPVRKLSYTSIDASSTFKTDNLTKYFPGLSRQQADLQTGHDRLLPDPYLHTILDYVHLIRRCRTQKSLCQLTAVLQCPLSCMPF